MDHLATLRQDRPRLDDGVIVHCTAWFFFICLSWGEFHVGSWHWVLPPGIYGPGPAPIGQIRFPPSVTIRGNLPDWPKITIGRDGQVTTEEKPDCETRTAEACYHGLRLGRHDDVVDHPVRDHFGLLHQGLGLEYTGLRHTDTSTHRHLVCRGLGNHDARPRVHQLGLRSPILGASPRRSQRWRYNDRFHVGAYCWADMRRCQHGVRRHGMLGLLVQPDYNNAAHLHCHQYVQLQQERVQRVLAGVLCERVVPDSYHSHPSSRSRSVQ